MRRTVRIGGALRIGGADGRRVSNSAVNEVVSMSGSCQLLRGGEASPTNLVGREGHHDVRFVSGACKAWRGSSPGVGASRGDTGGRRACHTLLSHEIFVRDASDGNF